MNIGVILQARMGSSRLPGKILKPIGDKLLLEHIFYRLGFLKHEVKVVLATSNSAEDDAAESFCRAHSIKCYRGSEYDVLERYYECAKQYGFHHVIRLTGDNPFVDVEAIDHLIDLHIGKCADYSHSLDSLPVGSGAEIMTFDALEKSFLNGTKPNHREHVNEYIQEYPSLFHIEKLQVDPCKNRPNIRLTIDTEDDYQRACFIVENSKNNYITTEEAVCLSAKFERSGKL